MAFDLSTWQTAKYRFSFVGDEGTSYIAEIHEDGHDNHTDDATADDLTTIESVGRDAVQVTWAPDGENEYAPMYFSEATLQFYDGSEAIAGDLIGALNTVDDKYLVVIREGNNLKWVGNIDPEGITYEEDGAIPLTISAVDGLGRLANRPYISATDGTAADEGATTLIAAIADCLNDTGFGLDFYVSSSMYHKTSPVLAATANPLENTWVNKLAFVAKKSTGDQAVTSKLSVLTEICAAFGLRCFQAEGAWHLVQANHFATSSYRRWRYDSTGAGKVTDSNAPNDYEDIDPRVTISNEDVIRTVATKTFLKGYNSSAVSYEHGPIQILRAPRFEPQDQLEANQFFGGGGTYPWSSAANAFLYLLNDGTWGMSVDSIDADGSAYTGYAEIAVSDVRAKIANAAGTGVGTLDAAIGSTYKSTQRSQQELQTGASIVISADAYCKSYGANPPADWWTYTDTYVAIQIKHYGSSTQYLKWGSDGSLDWDPTVNWLLLKNQSNLNGWLHIALQQIETIPSDGDIEVSLGPIISDETSQGIFERVVWDNVQVSPVLADGTINHETTTSLNFIDRSQPRPVRRSVILGDGPTSYNKGSMFSDSTLDTITQDWEETITGHSGTDTNVDHATLLGTMMLTSMNKIRPVHNAAYPGLGQILTPLDTLNRGGSYYPAWQITANYQREMSSGAWYLADENVFSNDLETGVSSGSHLVSDFGRGSSGVEGFNFNRIGSSFDTLIARESDRLATVNAAATGGTTVTCTALAYALKTGDPVFFQSKKTGYIMKRIVAADAAASATSFTVTVAFSASEPLNVGDPILPGSISGLRIDLDGVSIVNTHLKNDGTNAWNGTVDATGAITVAGTRGWIITRTGEAEFNDVTVRGSINAGGVLIGKDVGDVFVSGSPVAGEHGVWINGDNYWILDTNATPDKTHFRVGDSTDYMEWDETTPALKVVSSGATVFSSATASTGLALDGDLEIVSGKVVLSGSVSLSSTGIDLIAVSGNVYSQAKAISWDNGATIASYTPGTGQAVDELIISNSGGTGPTITITAQEVAVAASGTLRLNTSGTGATILGNTTGGVSLMGYATFPTADGTSGQVLQTNGSGALSWATVAGGTTTFTGLTDTPSAYTASGGYFVRVNATPNALEFVAPGSINVSSFNNDASYVASGANISVFTNDAGYTANTGDVVGPASATSGAVALFNGTTGKLIQNSSMTISGGTVTAGAWQGTAIAVLYGGTGATTQSGARSNLGLAIGSDVQAYNSGLASIAALVSPGADRLLYWNNGAANYGYLTLNISNFTNDSGYTTNTGDVVGPASATDNAVALFSGTTGKLIKNSSFTISGGTVTAGIWQGTAISVAQGGTGATDAATARTNLGLAIGTNVQAYNSGLASIAALVDPNADRIVYWNDGASNYGYLNISSLTAATAADWSSGYTLMQSTGGSLLRFSPGEVLASIGSLSDPNADRILIWDDSTGAVKFMSLGAGLSINATPTLLTSVRVDSSELQADAITTSATSRTFQTYAPFRIAGTLYYIPLYQ